jgi:hypothetical protein
MGRINEIVFDCGSPAQLAQFWAEVLEDYQRRPYDTDELARLNMLGLTPDTDTTVLLDGPGPSLCFQNVEGRRLDNNRVHVDVVVDDRAEETSRLLDLGASIVRVLPTYTVLTDPEGNQFCLVDSEDVTMTIAAE